MHKTWTLKLKQLNEAQTGLKFLYLSFFTLKHVKLCVIIIIIILCVCVCEMLYYMVKCKILSG